MHRFYYNHNNYMNNNIDINPFVIGKYLSGEYFCDREQETSFLIKQILNGRNVTLIADRRIGKSGLISHVFNQPEIQNTYHTIVVDLYATGSLAELVHAFSNEVYRTVKQQSSWLDKFFQVISSLRVGFKMDVITGSPSFDIGLGDIVTPEMTLEQIFSFLEMSDRPCLIAFDEFQQITIYPETNIEALLRTHIQRCTKTQFIFSGSRKHLMAQMFLSPAKPFYQSTINMGLEPIPKATYLDFAKRMFMKGNKQIADQAVEQVYDLCRGITWYMQMILNELYAMSKQDTLCTVDYIDEALRNVVQVQVLSYRELLATIPTRQKSLLYAISKEHGAKNITSSALIQKHKLASASSVQSALKGLVEKDIVIERDSIWRVYDVFFEQYIASMFDL